MKNYKNYLTVHLLQKALQSVRNDAEAALIESVTEKLLQKVFGIVSVPLIQIRRNCYLDGSVEWFTPLRQQRNLRKGWQFIEKPPSATIEHEKKLLKNVSLLLHSEILNQVHIGLIKEITKRLCDVVRRRSGFFLTAALGASCYAYQKMRYEAIYLKENEDEEKITKN